jgi:phosphoglycolate phosphatase-like HAD superfamily hydrolase/ADP-ribose pyrophosphatase YjhB (NUDIX family)
VIRNIIFDWSGTLVDDLPAVFKATNHVFRQAGLDGLTLERFRAEFCLPFRKFYDRFVPHIPLPQLEQWFHGHFKKAQDSVSEITRAREFLDYCRQRGIRMFVLSTVHRDHFATQAAVTGFGVYFERTYVGIADKQAVIVDVLKENGLNPHETLFIGDMQHDMDAARTGGTYSCAVLTGYSGLDQLRASGPDLVVEHLGELREILDEHAWEVQSRTERPIVTVGALISNASDQVLMVRTHKWSDLWGIPGGKVRFGEPSIDALRREIREETNLDVKDIQFVLVQDCIHSTEFYRDAHFILLNYTCRCDGERPIQLNEEAQEFRWVSLKEAGQLPLNGPTRILLEAVVRDRPHG